MTLFPKLDSPFLKQLTNEKASPNGKKQVAKNNKMLAGVLSPIATKDCNKKNGMGTKRNSIARKEPNIGFTTTPVLYFTTLNIPNKNKNNSPMQPNVKLTNELIKISHSLFYW
ncbi:MAG: hypothetical protein K2U26_10260 [Cyclobacteriaceae bacterium]|nr:hypothetical protein [Cyclobacteriaceae bacterium]